jgi:hypothetical protein
MEGDWDEVSRTAIPPPSPHVLSTTATTITFDDMQELLWVGNEYVGSLSTAHNMPINHNIWHGVCSIE